jgi:hypothetical protein
MLKAAVVWHLLNDKVILLGFKTSKNKSRSCRRCRNWSWGAVHKYVHATEGERIIIQVYCCRLCLFVYGERTKLQFSCTYMDSSSCVSQTGFEIRWTIPLLGWRHETPTCMTYVSYERWPTNGFELETLPIDTAHYPIVKRTEILVDSKHSTQTFPYTISANLNGWNCPSSHQF